MKKTKFAVLGGGNGGQSIGAYLTLKGYEASLYDRYENVIAPIKAKGGVELKGVSLTGFAGIKTITTNLGEAVDGAEVVLVVVPAFAHRYLAESLVPYLKDGQTIVLCPGSTGGVFEFRKAFKDKGCKARIKLGETSSLFYACRAEAPGVAAITGIKKTMPLAAFPSADADEIIASLREPYPQLVKEDNILTSDMSNLNAIIHPLPVLLNVGWIEKAGGAFKFYYDSISPSIGGLIERMDAERMTLCKGLGLKVKSVQDSLGAYYGVKAATLFEQVNKVEAYANIMSPANLNTRFLTEDIPMGLVPMAAIAEAAGIETPLMDMTIEIASRLLGRDFKAEGRNLGNLGLEGITKNDLLAFVEGKNGLIQGRMKG